MKRHLLGLALLEQLDLYSFANKNLRNIVFIVPWANNHQKLQMYETYLFTDF